MREYLVGKGVEAEALTAKGYGAADPVADNDSEDGRFRNRRIAFTVVKQRPAPASIAAGSAKGPGSLPGPSSSVSPANAD